MRVGCKRKDSISGGGKGVGDEFSKQKDKFTNSQNTDGDKYYTIFTKTVTKKS